jgi:hypothetical protein
MPLDHVQVWRMLITKRNFHVVIGMNRKVWDEATFASLQAHRNASQTLTGIPIELLVINASGQGIIDVVTIYPTVLQALIKRQNSLML